MSVSCSRFLYHCDVVFPCLFLNYVAFVIVASQNQNWFPMLMTCTALIYISLQCTKRHMMKKQLLLLVRYGKRKICCHSSCNSHGNSHTLRLGWVMIIFNSASTLSLDCPVCSSNEQPSPTPILRNIKRKLSEYSRIAQWQFCTLWASFHLSYLWFHAELLCELSLLAEVGWSWNLFQG